MQMRTQWNTAILLAVIVAGSGARWAYGQEAAPAKGSSSDAQARPQRHRFEGDSPGALPKGWRAALTAEKGSTLPLPTWRVVVDEGAPTRPHALALVETAATGRTFNLAIAEEALYQDLDVNVWVKPVSGKEDQGGGPVWRLKDENNYYVCRYNPLEGNFRLYKVVDGKREQLASESVVVEPDRWYHVRVIMLGSKITCFLDGRPLLEVDDETFPAGGKVGLWTKADALTAFDDLDIRPLAVSGGK